MRIFCDGFASKSDWRRFMVHAYGDSPDLWNILANETGWDDKRSCLRRFQDMYIACWLYHPLEKGTFMLSLDGAKNNVERGYRSLDARWSSHLSKRARSAGEGFYFLKGYKELLVQIEGDFVFLKAEGHRASGDGAISSVRHVGGWISKSITGSGNTASPELKFLAEKRPDLAIQRRNAENYGRGYQSLLRNQLKLRGPRINVRLVIDEIILLLTNGVGEASEFFTLLTENGFDKNLVSTQNLTHRDMGRLLRDVVRPFVAQTPGAKLHKLMNAASGEVDGLIQCLLDDIEELDTKTPRYFHEVRTCPPTVTEALRAFALTLERSGSEPERDRV